MQTDAQNITPHEQASHTGLVDAVRVLELIWPDPASRPSLRWLREQQKKRTLPFVKLGHLVFFNPDRVKRELERKFTVNVA